MEKKFELMKDSILEYDGKKFYRIKALRNFNDVKIGDIGGYVEKEKNLSHNGNCWLYDNARVIENGFVCDNATARGFSVISNNAKLFGNAKMFDKSILLDFAKVYENAEIHDNAAVFDDSEVFGNAKAIQRSRIYNDAEICLNGLIKTNFDYVTMQNLGNRFGAFTFFKLEDGNIGYSSIGDNKRGTLEEFIERCENSKYPQECNAIAKLIKIRFNRNK